MTQSAWEQPDWTCWPSEEAFAAGNKAWFDHAAYGGTVMATRAAVVAAFKADTTTRRLREQLEAVRAACQGPRFWFNDGVMSIEMVPIADVLAILEAK